MINLSAAGLTETEAKTYQALITKKDWQPSELAKIVGESRTNMYKILDNLVEKKLAKRYDKAKKLHYQAENPAQLLELAHNERKLHEQREKELELHSQALIRDFIKTHEQAGVRYFEGKEGIRDLFDAIEQSSEEVLFVHTVAGTDFYGYDTMHEIRMKAVKSGVKRRGLTPDTPLAHVDYLDKDKLVGLTRTWLDASDYTAPVEWGAFDNKLYIISYGDEALGMLIESPQIAEGFKQLFKLIERGQHLLPSYTKLPRLAAKKGRTD